MNTVKYRLSIFVLMITLFNMISAVNADTITETKSTFSQSMTSLIEQYESKIRSLEEQNKILRNEIISLKTTWVKPVSSVSSGSLGVSTINTVSSSGAYTRIIEKFNTSLPLILDENNLSASGVIGVFEFIEPNNVFISIDDGKNPPGVTAFKTKILYTFDSSLSITKIGLFDLNYEAQKYTTVYGTNPHANSTRIRIQNPKYKGRLLDIPNNVMGSVGGGAMESIVTFSQIKDAYTKNKLLDALKLSESYLTKNPNDIEILKIRYRSFYMIGKYTESLTEIKKIEAMSGTAFERTVACDAAVIGKIIKKKDVSDFYGAICKKK